MDKTFLFLSFLILPQLFYLTNSQIDCHYTCNACFGTEYYQCISCPTNRGDSDFQPISGMCYCTNETDQDLSGNCLENNQFNYNNKSMIAIFIGLSLLFTLIGAMITGIRHFFIKTIQDVQQISIIVFINLYFPQQFDIFLTKLYRFNISSFTFQAMASGSLFTFEQNELIQSTDGQNVYGKYKLLYKTANFFSNQFTWIIVFLCFVAAAIILRLIRKSVKACQKENGKDNGKENGNQKLAQVSFETEPNINQIHSNKKQSLNNPKQSEEKTSCIYRFINKIYNFVWLNFFITFFFLSLIEININIFTQIGNLTFSSSFAAVGAFFSAVFLGLQIVILALLALKIREETIKPEWMRDYTYTAAIYLIRTNYKTVTKYFWFFACMKKILIPLMITALYQSPKEAILAISGVEMVFICFSVYCQPFQRRYIRIHYYASEGMKLFIYLCLINFTEQYVSYSRMIELTKVLYIMVAFFFGFNLFFIVVNMFVERDMYIRAWIKKFYPESDSQYKQGRLGYHSEGKLYIFERQ